MTNHSLNMVQPALLYVVVFVIASSRLVPLQAQSIDFDKQIAPILVSRCLECHQGTESEGGLNLTEMALVTKGGDSGAAVVPGKATDSLLWERVSADEMPPKHPLSTQDKSALKRWIEEGANWGTGPLDLFSFTTDRRAGRDWWSLLPLSDVSPPAIKSPWVRNEIDAFVLRRLQIEGLQPSSQADPRTLIRRVYFDLVGLPPTPDQVAAYVSNPSNAAYQKIVDELLQSKHYGERWGRHWLDVVRFGESDGFERNFQRENAWHYRDWVIDSLNSDMPYDQFVRMQLIGDQEVGGVQGAAATGFWVAGVHNTTVGGSKRMKQLARQDEIEEVLGTVGQTFVGLTFNCARCHDHKFDPISQTEYYQLASAISGLGFGDRDIPVPEEQAKLAQLGLRLAELRRELAEIDRSARVKVIAARNQEAVPATPPAALARWEFDNDLNDSIGGLHGIAHGGARIEDGALLLDGKSFVETQPLVTNLAEKTLEAWVQLDDLEQRGGAAISIESRNGEFFDAIVFGEREPGRWMAGSNGFVRTDSFEAPQEKDATQRPVHIALVYQHDGTIIGYRDGLPYGHSVRKSPFQPFKGEDTEILFGLRHKPGGGNRYLTGRIHRAALYDRALSQEEIAVSAGNSAAYVSEEQLVAALTKGERDHRAALKVSISELVNQRNRQASKATFKIYTLAASKGEITNVLLRGDPDNEGEVVSPATTAAIHGLSPEFGLAPDAPEAQRRRKLAEWITHENNPLFTRVIVNRIWHYHFGTGIVDTPNDFGFNGGQPSHPELLDYLAQQFQQNGSRLKWLHRLIVNSSTYQQAVPGPLETHGTKAADTDATNRLLWRANIRRIEAESLRDAMLHVSGQLNEKAGGPSFKDVSVTLNSGTTYYEPLDIDGPDFFRRTVYRFNPRGGRSALLDTFDCPDPASTAPRRSVTTTPLQSLSLMNNPLVARMSDYFADRVREDAGEDTALQITRAWQLAIARDPTVSERTLSEQLVRKHGLSALCRGLFNINEFVVIE
ncbi:hypothetical protein C5Y96_20170 [Blastopirellula marina]|uniref:Cytochrome c domain-containing protein n=1 Tax=Blastopirellula marina TaxID=124 RepID=A0A2S8F2F7_9BACT|nr:MULTISPECIES: DUF1553 domain-containing protein [Pirellulaceae]PQO26356.1 hypothetical protein C5Y96_20170 [Blastopirellula marina]RCS44812.1 DUF1553 domain-containing protein [Bremerella cremea]